MKKGFTLIELSIVLIIIGLLVGGIIAGQSLIKSAEIRAVISELQTHIATLRTFDDKYNGLPGDFDNAVGFFGATTEDGDDNGLVDSGTTEPWTYWEHLSLAGLIEGSFNGSAGTDVGTNVPKGPVDGSSLYMQAGQLDGASSPWRNWLWITSSRGLIGTIHRGGAMSLLDIYTVDEILDDAIARSGKVQSQTGWVGTSPGTTDCEYTASDLSGLDEDTNGQGCTLIFDPK